MPGWRASFTVTNLTRLQNVRSVIALMKGGDSRVGIMPNCHAVHRAWGKVSMVIITVAEEYKPPSLADFSPMLDISLIRCTVHSDAAHFSPTDKQINV